jgi:hypothetical protein
VTRHLHESCEMRRTGHAPSVRRPDHRGTPPASPDAEDVTFVDPQLRAVRLNALEEDVPHGHDLVRTSLRETSRRLRHVGTPVSPMVHRAHAPNPTATVLVPSRASARDLRHTLEYLVLQFYQGCQPSTIGSDLVDKAAARISCFRWKMMPGRDTLEYS